MPIDNSELQKYADVVVRVGLNLQSGQRLYVGGPNIETAPLIRQIVASAYSAGSSYVDVIYTDEEVDRIRYQAAPADSFSTYPEWPSRALLEYAKAKGAALWTIGGDPDLLAGENAEHVAIADAARSRAMMPAFELISKNALNWCAVGIPVRPWARKVYPELEEARALDELWRAVLHMCRIDTADPIGAWNEHIRQLEARASSLNERSYHALAFSGPGTNLTVELAAGHRWHGGRIESVDGVWFTPNLPTEEVFTLPNREGVNGDVTTTRPFSWGGVMIDTVKFTFSKGRVTNLTAKEGERYLQKLLETDDGSPRLGEVALVPHSSPIAQSGRLFYNPLIDENAECHIALGSAYRFTMEGAEELSEEEFGARGGNSSSIHLDFMIGSGEVDVDGVTGDGRHEPLMRDGEWTFTV